MSPRKVPDHNTPDTEHLLAKIHEGRSVNESELSHIARLLMSTKENATQKLSVDDIYSLLSLLGATKSKKHRHLLEYYLDSDDCLTVSLVLETLCLKWEETGEYLERVIHFALGVSWDLEQDVQQTALKIVGEYLYDQRHAFADRLAAKQTTKRPLVKLFELLLSVFHDQKNDRFVRQTAYFSLCRATGKPWEEIPSECAVLDLTANSTDIDQTIIKTVENLISTYSPSSSPPSSSPSRLSSGKTPTSSTFSPGTR